MLLILCVRFLLSKTQAKPAFWFSAPAGAHCKFQSADTAVTNIVGIRAYGTSLREAKPLILTLCSSSCETDFVCFAERTHRRDGGF